MATKQWYYVLDLPKELRESLKPFRVDEDSESDERSDESSDSEGDSEDSDSEEQTKAGSKGETPPVSADTEAVTRKATPGDASATATTQYLEPDDVANAQWEREHLAHLKGSPFVAFSSTLLPSNKVLRVYKGWLDKDMLIDRPVEALGALNPQGLSAVLLVGGGHFAGAIISHKAGRHKSTISNPFANITVLESKAFHRYTTRRKQGGAQSASDNAHGKANSAGSTIRRANERMLQQEIAELLRRWAPLLHECQRIFYRAPGRSNRGLLTGYAGAPLDTADPRLRSIPFATGRATFDECRRAWLQLTRAPVGDAPELPEIVQAQSPLNNQTAPQTRQETIERPKPREPSPDERLSSRIVDLVKRSRLPQLQELFNEHSVDFRLQPAAKFSAWPTPLLYAASIDKHRVVTALLQWGADPTVRTASDHALGDLAKPNAKTVDALQVVRAELGEAAWDWTAAKVGPPLSREDLVARDVAEKLRLREERERLIREQEQREKHERLEALIAKHGTGRMTGGMYQATRGLTKEELQHVERERRARAVEARMARFSNPSK